jgi:Tol biopolymer transport system component
LSRRLPLSALFAFTVTLGTTFSAPVANASFPGQNGRVAYVTSVGDHQGIYTVEATGGSPQPLIDLGSGRDAINPAWSWDGTMIAFAGQTSPGGPFAIYTANADGSGTPTQVTTPPISDTDPTWDPAGGQIAFVRAHADGFSQIAIVDLTSSTVRALGSSMGTDLEPAWSPEGSTIAFVSKAFPPVPCPQNGCRFNPLIAYADGSGLAAGDPSGYSTFRDWHHPDWSPDGSKMVARFGEDDFPLNPSGVQLFDASNGLPIDTIGPCGIMTEPLFSPDGAYVVVTSRTLVSLEDPTLTDPALCVLPADDSAPFWVNAPASDAAWGAVPGSSPVPQRDTTPPTLALSFAPEPGSSGWFSSAPQVEVTATDNVGVRSIYCTYDGERLTANDTGLVDHGLRAVFDLYGTGEHTLACSAWDLQANRGSVSQPINIGDPPPSPSPTPTQDTTPPHVDPPSFSANPIVVDGVSTVTAFAWDDESGIDFGTVSVGDRPPDPMAWSGYAFTADVGPGLPAGLYAVSVNVSDVAGNEATSDPQTLVVYDPNAGSVSGTGWIVPDPRVGDELPGIDGKTKASFDLTARYKSPSATTPTGSFVFTYGKQFKLQSEVLDWLVVTAGDTAHIQGTASIRDGGVYPFRVTVRDGATTDSPDRLLLEVCACNIFAETGPIIYRASGEVGGQIKIQR